jgi:hypothetical protein
MERVKVFAMTALTAITFAAGSPARAQAQASLLGPGAAYIGGGISQLETGALNDRLAANGYPTFGRTAGSPGIGAYRILSNGLMLGIEATGLVMDEKMHDGREVRIGGGYATLGVGYLVPLSRRTRVYPRLGVGGGGLSLVIREKEDTVLFDDVLSNPQPAASHDETILTHAGFVVDLGGGLEFLPSRRGGSPLIGLRVGYLLAASNNDWDNVYQGVATGGPEASISGVYLRVVIGGAWRR